MHLYLDLNILLCFSVMVRYKLSDLDFYVQNYFHLIIIDPTIWQSTDVVLYWLLYLRTGFIAAIFNYSKHVINSVIYIYVTTNLIFFSGSAISVPFLNFDSNLLAPIFSAFSDSLTSCRWHGLTRRYIPPCLEKTCLLSRPITVPDPFQ